MRRYIRNSFCLEMTVLNCLDYFYLSQHTTYINSFDLIEAVPQNVLVYGSDSWREHESGESPCEKIASPDIAL